MELPEGYDIILRGKDPMNNIVGLSHIQEEGERDRFEVYVRDGEKVSSFGRDFYPYFHLSDIELLGGYDTRNVIIRELDGDNHFKYLVVFNTWFELYDAKKRVVKNAKEGDRPSGLYFVPNPSQQFLSQTGYTFFGGMTFDDAYRMNVDIETFSSKGGFPDANRKGDKIFIVVLSDNRGWKQTLYLNEKAAKNVEKRDHWTPYDTEEGLLLGFLDIVREKDPDVLHLHNGFAFDLPYIETRCGKLGIPFTLGRGDTVPRSWDSSKKFAERDVAYKNFDVPGRCIVDTYFESMSYDVFKRDLPGYGLKTLAKYFDFATADREYVEGDEISNVWLSDPKRILDYADDDAFETGMLAAQLGASTFYLSQIIPMDYQRVGLSGSATKIEALLNREYLRRTYSLPTMEEGRAEVGGYTDVFATGLFKKVIYADVESLYPSIMMTYDVQPDGDDLDVFPYVLRLLTDLRFAAKDEMKTLEKGSVAYAAKEGEQAAYKVIINSFFGMLGFPFAIWNDFSEADRITTTGQSILNSMIDIVERDGGSVIEADTDGLLITAPPHVSYNGEDETRMSDEEYVASMTSEMDEGIKIGFDGRADVMLSYKKKNYALREPGKKKNKIKGGSFISRLYEPFGKVFIADVIDALLDEDTARVHEIYRRTWLKIVSSNWTPEEFSKTATLKDPIKTYLAKVEKGSGNGGRNRSAPYELAYARQQAGGQRAEPGDRISYYIAGEAKAYKVRAFEDAKLVDEWTQGDENTNHYIKRLKEFSKKFEVFFSKEDFKKIFSEKHDPDFNYAGVEIVNRDIVRHPIPVIIAGSRSVDDIFWIQRAIAGASFLKTVDKNGEGYRVGAVISGTAKGADRLGEAWAHSQGIDIIRMPADWDTYGKKAGMLRNIAMAEKAKQLAEEWGVNACGCIIVWDGESKGSRHMEKIARERDILTHVSMVT